MCELCHFSAHSSSTKKFEIINFKWLNTELLELISIVSADCRTDIDSNNPTMNQCRHFIVFYYQSINYLSNYLAVTLLFDWPMSRKFRQPAHQDIFWLTGTPGHSQLSSSSNDFSSSMTWQMLSRAVLFVTRHRSKLVGILLVYLVSFQTHH